MMIDMIDGPHRTLPLSNRWKQVAERLADGNYSPAQLLDSLRRAIADEWRSDVDRPFLNAFLRILHQPQPDLHYSLTAQLDDLRPQAHGHYIRPELLELARDSMSASPCPDDSANVVSGVLCGLVARRRNQIVVHYRLEAPDLVFRIEERLDGLQQEIERNLENLARQVTKGSQLEIPPILKKTGLDDGVPV